MSNNNITSSVIMSNIDFELSAAFDYEFSGEVTFNIKDNAEMKKRMQSKFGIGLIVGSSGSGKSITAEQSGLFEECFYWDNERSICSHFNSAQEAQEKLCAVGLNSVPSWMKPFSTLSTGEKFRASLAISLKNNSFFDEFTSVVDRNVAKSCSKSIRKYIDRAGLTGIVLASCHYDIIEWLQPDWIFDTSTGELTERRADRQFPKIEIKIRPCTWESWAAFSKHHYLDSKINKSATFWLASWDGVDVGFCSTIAFPNGNIKNGRRGHRTVVLPDYQGMGIGVRISDAIAKLTVEAGHRYFSKTSHFAMGEYRQVNKHWKPTSKNKKSRNDYNVDRKTKEDGHKMKHKNRVCYSHEYILNPE